MDNRSIQAFGWSQEAQNKLDYFICGVAGALFAYIGQTYTPRKLEIGVNAFEPLAVLFLALSFFLGLKRIETANLIQSLNAQMLHFAESAGKLTKTLADSTGNAPFINIEGGEVLDLKGLQSKREEFMSMKEQASAAIQKHVSFGNWYYKARNLCLIFGFGILLLSKVLHPYFITAPPPRW